MTELKTLKELRTKEFPMGEGQEQFIRAEAVKWIKEDIEDSNKGSPHWIIQRWMERLNITEENLK